MVVWRPTIAAPSRADALRFLVRWGGVETVATLVLCGGLGGGGGVVGGGSEMNLADELFKKSKAGRRKNRRGKFLLIHVGMTLSPT